jgi:hypothetical protein
MSFSEQGPAIALTKCFYCQESNEILLQTRNIGHKDARIERMHGHVINMRPCPTCEGYMQQGIILITIDSGKSTPGWHKPPADCPRCNGSGRTDQFNSRKCETCGGDGKGYHSHIPNPWRTGGWWVVREEAVKRILGPHKSAQSSLQQALKYRWLFIEHEAAEKLGFFEAGKAAPQVGEEQP